MKPLSDALLLGMEDGFAPVRDSAAESLGTLHRIVGDRAMAAVVDTLDDIKRKKVLDFSAKAEVRCKGAEASKSGNKAAGKAAVSMAPKLPAMRPVSDVRCDIALRIHFVDAFTESYLIAGAACQIATVPEWERQGKQDDFVGTVTADRHRYDSFKAQDSRHTSGCARIARARINEENCAVNQHEDTGQFNIP